MSVRLLLLVCALSTGCLFHLDRELSAGEIHGTVVYRTAQGTLLPASAAVVTLEDSTLSATADDQGTFALDGLPSGSFVLDITGSPAGLSSGESGVRLTGITLAPGNGVDLGQIELGALGSIQGSVDLDGSSVGSGAVATLVGVAEVAVTNGQFVFPTLLAGEYQVVVFDPGTTQDFVSQPTVVQVAPGQMAGVSVALSPATTGAIEGMVQVSGASSNGGVHVQLSGGGPSLTTSDSGAYESGGLPAGLYTVTASLEGFDSIVVPDIPIGTGTTVVPPITLSPLGAHTADAGSQTCLVDTECPVGQTCIAGVCGVVVDAGPPDAGPFDAGTCSCSIDTGCTGCPDGTICNLSGVCVTPQYAVDADAGTVTDEVTGLVWQQAVPAAPCPSDGAGCNWSDAISYCQNLSLDGTGWTLPTLPQLFSLVATGMDPSINQAFQDVPNSLFWTATGAGSGDAWVVSFNGGGTNYLVTFYASAVLCVR